MLRFTKLVKASPFNILFVIMQDRLIGGLSYFHWRTHLRQPVSWWFHPIFSFRYHLIHLSLLAGCLLFFAFLSLLEFLTSVV